ncbi:MAG: tyrosine-type recombinase/integrase [Syntrophomonadaceae bacterium]|jgi:integrase|nr:tyrosine-type recombinase/integrase [Syntrophomonadaceae bacterium]
MPAIAEKLKSKSVAKKSKHLDFLLHTHATLLLQRGIPAKLAQERLGHSSITMTLDLYSHVTPEMAKLAAASLDGLLDKRKGPAKVQGE